ncbi:hydrolase [Solwaraspora sp. WMMD1047]|uniref:dienelactone hydrolase family protein n=1 Tax=Solwaraspora sp. WMMD1047 TaxID=3016102 RepID=UPI002415A044|nr:hydrolase [Solwaraspora sp. WMMD1047]MDG4833750.1 hydrolase [Solwaraspora sp. WMMD1047]
MEVTVTGTTVPVGPDQLDADVRSPEPAVGTVLFAHGSGSSRRSPRNLAVAQVLNGRGLATVLVDLLTEEEARQDSRDGRLRFDIGLLADRLTGVLDWLVTAAGPTVPGPIGLFGASTGAAAALVTAAARPMTVPAVVSRGGRPDLAGAALTGVRAATLLLVGGDDEQVRQLNQAAMPMLSGPVELRTIPGAGHLFEEPGTLGQVADAAAGWFVERLPARA